MRFTPKLIVATMLNNVSRIDQAAAASFPNMLSALDYLKTYLKANISYVARRFHVYKRTLSNYRNKRLKLIKKKLNKGYNKIMKFEYIQTIFLYIENQVYIRFATIKEMIQGAIRYLLA
jgi:hypothetical protein